MDRRWSLVLAVLFVLAAPVVADDTLAWSKSVQVNLPVIVSDMEMASTASGSMDLIGLRQACVYLKDDSSAALLESRKFVVSSIFQAAKDYYESSLNEFYLSSVDIIAGIDTMDVNKLQSGITHLQTGSRYLTLATKEIQKQQ